MTGVINFKNQNKFKTIFWGYHESGIITLKKLLDSTVIEIIAVIIPPNRTHNSIVEIYRICHKYNIPVLCQSKLSSKKFIEDIKSMMPDIYIVDSYTKLLPASILSLPSIGGFNLHPGLLPYYKGAHTLNWSIIEGAKSTGLSLHLMNEKFDDGPVVKQKEVSIGVFDRAVDLDKKLQFIISDLIDHLENSLSCGKIHYEKQAKDFRTYPFRKAEDGEVLNSLSAKQIYNLVRGVSYPWPGAFIKKNGYKIIIWWGLPVEIKVDIPPGELVSSNNTMFIVGSDQMLFEIKTINRLGSTDQYEPLSGSEVSNHLVSYGIEYVKV